MPFSKWSPWFLHQDNWSLKFFDAHLLQGEMVYANFGSDVDFEDLQRMGVTVKDKIVLIRYGLIPRNKKVS